MGDRHNLSETYGTPVSFTIACIGTITNTISITYFLRRKNRNLGDKYLVLLNSVDIMICIYSLGAMIAVMEAHSPPDHTNSDDELIKHHERWSSTIFEVLIEFSGLATCFLCALRAISISRPLYQISRTKVYVSTFFAVLYIIAGNAVIYIFHIENVIADDDARVSYTMQLSLINISLMIVFVLMCSVVSIRELKKTRPGGEGGDRNEKATKMVVILGVIFLTFNLVWMLTLVYFWMEDDVERRNGKTPDEGDIAMVKMVTFILMSINSAGNPIVYMTRNEEMNRHVMLLFSRIRNFICRR